MAVGNPLGLAGTVTTGIVSALNRPVTTGGRGQSGQSQAEPVVTNAIQTSAAINPGNSGGALVNASGQLVGINSSIATLGSSQGGQGGSIGIGFAIPVNEAKSIATQLIDKGSAQHAFLGVTSEDGTAADGKASRAGATIGEVSPGTPAAEAGLRSGDTVIAVDGDLVDSSLSLVAHVRERSVGDKVTSPSCGTASGSSLTASLDAQAPAAASSSPALRQRGPPAGPAVWCPGPSAPSAPRRAPTRPDPTRPDPTRPESIRAPRVGGRVGPCVWRR